MTRFIRTCVGEDDVSCARQSADFEVMENIIEKVRKHGRDWTSRQRGISAESIACFIEVQAFFVVV